MDVLFETANMTVTSSDGRTRARPGLSISYQPGLQKAVLHLTRGSNAIVAGDRNDSAAAAAIEFTGAVEVRLARGESGNAGFEFNFIQYVMEPICRATYAGLAGEGSIVMNVTEPVAQYRLDSRSDVAPFPNRIPAQSSVGPRGAVLRTNRFGDHPNGDFYLIWPNRRTQKRNFLVRVQKQLQFLTAFTVKNRGDSTYQLLSYVNWSAAWDFGVSWRTNAEDASVASAYEQISLFNVGDVSREDPPGVLLGLFEDPSGEMYADIHGRLVQSALSEVDNANCSYSVDWPKGFIPLFL
jgi:hypothetical protein